MGIVVSSKLLFVTSNCCTEKGTMWMNNKYKIVNLVCTETPQDWRHIFSCGCFFSRTRLQWLLHNNIMGWLINTFRHAYIVCLTENLWKQIQSMWTLLWVILRKKLSKWRRKPFGGVHKLTLNENSSTFHAFMHILNLKRRVSIVNWTS